MNNLRRILRTNFKFHPKYIRVVEGGNSFPKRFLTNQPEPIVMKEITGIPLKEVIQKLDNYAPLNLAEEWDNVGLLIEPYTQRPIKTIFLTIDLTEAVLHEAISKKTDLIISYHPPIFAPLKRITQSTWKERIVALCFENRIALYSPHTAWDAMYSGVNMWLAKAFPFTTIQKLDELKEIRTGSGSGRLLTITTNDFTLRKAIDSVKKHASIPHVHVAIGTNKTLDDPIKTVGICAGAGSSVLKGVQADLYVTGEMSHHDILAVVHSDTSVILCNHSNSERGFLNEFREQWQPEIELNVVHVVISEVDKDPITTY